MIVLGVEPPSSIEISVNMTPTTQLFEYHPVTSVSRVEAESADTIFPRIFPFFAEGISSPISIRRSMNGFRERSLLFRSRAIIRRNSSAFKMPRSPSDVASEIGLSVTP